jgi:hypothetical protein
LRRKNILMKVIFENIETPTSVILANASSVEDKGGTKNLRQVRVQRSLDSNLLTTLRASLQNLKIAGNGLSLLVIKVTRFPVAYPSVGTTTTGVHPHDVLETEVITQSHIDDLDGHCDELPALVADVGLVAARTDIVVIRKIYIETQLLGHRSESGRTSKSLPFARID